MITKEYEEIITVLPDGELQYLRVTIILEDGVELSRTNWRAVYNPLQDPFDLPGRAHDIAITLWTAPVMAAYDRKLLEAEGAERARLEEADIEAEAAFKRELEALNAPRKTL